MHAHRHKKKIGSRNRIFLATALLWTSLPVDKVSAAAEIRVDARPPISPIGGGELAQAIGGIALELPPLWRGPVDHFLGSENTDPHALGNALMHLPVTEVPGLANAAPMEGARRLIDRAAEGAAEHTALILMGLDLILTLSPLDRTNIARSLAAQHAYSALPPERRVAVERTIKDALARLMLPPQIEGASTSIAAEDSTRRFLWKGIQRWLPNKKEPEPARISARLTDGRIHALTEAQFKERFGVTYTPTLYFSREPSSALIESGPAMYAEVPLTQRLIIDAYRPQATGGHTAPLFIDKVSDEVGLGLFAGSDIHPRQMIGEYAGQVVASIVATLSGKTEYAFGYPSHPNFIIDPKRRGNLIRYANHSVAHANSFSLPVFDGRLWHIILVASRKISRGSQILFNYGGDYWTTRDSRELRP